MKRIKTLVVAILVMNILHGQNCIDVLHYKFDIGLSNENDTIYGSTDIHLRFLQPVKSFSFQLVLKNKSGKGMVIDRIKGPEIKEFTKQNDSIIITLKKEFKVSDTAIYTIRYHGVPADGLIISRNKYGDRTFFSDNWPNRAHNWIPCIDDPSDKATCEFFVTAPREYKVISNGAGNEELFSADNKILTHWKEDVPLPTKVMVIGVAKFAVKEFEDSPPGIPVSAWVYPQDSLQGFKNYSVAPGIVKFYSDYIGPYPYNKLANVQSKTIFGGMENASAIFYFEGSAEESTSIEDLLAHEIAHQWFGDMATEKSFAHLWLSEGFATYMSDIYLQTKYGEDTLSYLLKQARAKVIDFSKGLHRAVVDSVSPLMTLLNANSYEKGAWILHMLRRQVGDSLFRAIIRTYYDRFKGKNADTEDFRRVAEQASGKNLEQFFKQWLYTPGLPQLSIRHKFDEKAGELTVVVTQLQNPIFQFPLDIQIDSDARKSKTTTVQIAEKVETFKFKVQKKLLRVTFDPNTSLLFEEIKK